MSVNQKEMVRPEVLIAEGEDPLALAILRSLAAKGIGTAIMSSFPRCISFSSRYCKTQILVPSMAHEEKFAKAVEKIVKKTRFNVLFPIFEWSLLPISENRDRIGRYVRLPISSHQSILTCFDKSSTLKLASNNGIPIPKTYFVQNLAELNKISEEIKYPCVVKPRFSVVWMNGRAFNRRPGYANSASDLSVIYKDIHRNFPFPLIQEYIPGTNYSVAAICKEGKLKGLCCIKVTRAWPPTGGNSCFRESVPLEPRMREYSEKLLEALNWYGIAEVEFRLDSRDNVPRLLEINPRFWGSLPVAIKSGVDFPYLLYRLAMDGDISPVFSYKVGIKGRFLEQDLLYIFSLFGQSAPNLNTHKGRRCVSLIKWLKFYEPRIFYDLFDLEDPLPFVLNSEHSVFAIINLLREKKYPGSTTEVRF
jgi:predicted ATP-grasp superfamily ATP-dependent carboligase